MLSNVKTRKLDRFQSPDRFKRTRFGALLSVKSITIPFGSRNRVFDTLRPCVYWTQLILDLFGDVDAFYANLNVYHSHKVSFIHDASFNKQRSTWWLNVFGFFVRPLIFDLQDIDRTSLFVLSVSCFSSSSVTMWAATRRSCTENRLEYLGDEMKCAGDVTDLSIYV